MAKHLVNNIVENLRNLIDLLLIKYQYTLNEELYKGSHPTRKTWNFVIYFSRPGKYLEFVQKVGKTWNFNSKL